MLVQRQLHLFICVYTFTPSICIVLEMLHCLKRFSDFVFSFIGVIETFSDIDHFVNQHYTYVVNNYTVTHYIQSVSVLICWWGLAFTYVFQNTTICCTQQDKFYKFGCSVGVFDHCKHTGTIVFLLSVVSVVVLRSINQCFCLLSVLLC